MKIIRMNRTARNAGIKKTQAPMVLVLDGDDRLEPEYIECVSKLLLDNPSMVAASSWMQTFGVLDSIICPSGGKIGSFLSHNCCPATHILRREIFEQCGGYDESMRSGFEDWDFFLSMLETLPESLIGIVDKPLIKNTLTLIISILWTHYWELKQYQIQGYMVGKVK